MDRIDKKLFWTGLIYFGGLMLLGVAWWKALIVAAIVSVSWYLTYARQVVGGSGVVILLVGLAVSFGLLPVPSEWRQLLALMHP
jgi:hypothetical protein